MAVFLVIGYFTALAGFFLTRLFPVWNSAIPGGLEDTRLFLWNAWWFHHAVSVLHTSPFRTRMLFYPFGCRLVSHDFPLWMNLITFSGQRAGLTMIAASNLWFILSWILLGLCVYALAREVTGQTPVALVAGTYAMTHSYTLARAMQNWGQFNAWSIALFLWLLVRARRRRDSGSFALAGAALAWNAACHYYFLIYSALIWLAIAAADMSPRAISIMTSSPSDSVGDPWVPRQWPRGMTNIRGWLFGLSVVCGTIGLVIALHPGVYRIAGTTISMQTPENPIFTMWVLLMAWGMTFLRVHVSDHDGSRPTTRRDDGKGSLRNHLILAATAAFLLSPLIWGSLRLVLEGGYPKQSILWKTHLRGANLLALFGPNPLQALWGPAVSQWYTVRGMNPQEQAAAIGWVCLAVVLGSQIWKADRRARRWLTLACAATVLALGTHLHIAQHNLWCPLPFFWLRLLPVVGNVRVPERWMAVGAIAWSVVLAMALAKLAARRKGSAWKIGSAVAALVLFENWPGLPVRPAPAISPVYERLRELPPGAVLPVPLYIGDSSIGAGNALNGAYIFPWDHLWAQVVHEKPMLGGFVGRISRRLIDNYKADPFIRTLLDLEENKPVDGTPQPAAGARAVETFRFRYVLVYPPSTEASVLKYVFGSLPLELIDHDPSVQLYRIKESPPVSSASLVMLRSAH